MNCKKHKNCKNISKKMKECVNYFSPETNSKYTGIGSRNYPLSEDAKAKIKFNKYPFIFKLFKKSKTTANCELHIKGYFGGMPIEVDKDFVDYCKAYFENRLKKAEAEFESFKVGD